MNGKLSVPFQQRVQPMKEQEVGRSDVGNTSVVVARAMITWTPFISYFLGTPQSRGPNQEPHGHRVMLKPQKHESSSCQGQQPPV